MTLRSAEVGSSMLRSPLLRAVVAVPVALALAGAAVNLRLLLSVGLAPDWGIARQGLEVAAWFVGFVVLAAALLAALATRHWPAFAGRRLAVAAMTYALAAIVFMLAFAAFDPTVAEDRLAHMYLAVGSLAYALSAPPVKPARDLPATDAPNASQA